MMPERQQVLWEDDCDCLSAHFFPFPPLQDFSIEHSKNEDVVDEEHEYLDHFDIFRATLLGLALCSAGLCSWGLWWMTQV